MISRTLLPLALRPTVRLRDSLRLAKKAWILPAGFLILLVLIGGALLPAVAETIAGSAKFDPDYIDLSIQSPSVVNGTIRFPSGKQYTVKDINTSTIWLEGSLQPSSTVLIPGGLVCTFDGDMMVSIIWSKIYHMGMLPPSSKVWLTITGNLKDSLGAIPFTAEGYIKVA